MSLAESYVDRSVFVTGHTGFKGAWLVEWLTSLGAEVTGYALEATDGKIGHVAGFLVDDRNWAIRELVVEAGHWYSGKEIRIPTSKVERISYKDMKVFVNLSKADINMTPEHAIVKANEGRIQPHS